MGPRHNGLILAGRHKINHDAMHLAPVLNGLPFGATFTFFLARFASWCDVRLKTETTPCRDPFEYNWENTPSTSAP